MNLFQTIGKVIITGALTVASFFGLYTQPVISPNVGATIPTVVAVFQTSLQTSITSSATSMTLVSGTDKAGNSISGYMCFNIDEGTAIEEFVCGTASGTSITSMIRGIDPVDGDLEVTALKKAHRRGASVKVTNYPALAVNSRILNGNETLPNPISYATGVGPVSSSDLADKEYVLSVVNGGTVTFNQEIVSATAGETVSAGQLLYFDETQNEWMKTDADTLATLFNVNLGIAQGSGTDGNAISGGVLTSGEYTTSGLTKGDLVYASNTAGAFTSGTAGTVPRIIGTAKDSTTLLFNPNFQSKLYDYAVDASGTDAYAITLAGGLSVPYVGMEVTFKAGTANTGGATLAINGGSAKTIVKNVSTALATGDILANQIVKVVYNGTNWQIVSVLPPNPTLPTVQVFSGNGTYTPPANVVYVIAEMVGGGGGGGAASGNNSGGGGSGAYGKWIIPIADIGASKAVTIGAAGAAGNNGNGGAGGDTSLGTLAIAGGGAGGVSSSGAGGAGGTASGSATLMFSFSVAGGSSIVDSAPTPDTATSGQGGSSFWGQGGQLRATSPAAGSGNMAGASASGYGSGGGGSIGTNTGAAGTIGYMVITEYYN